MSGQYVNPPIVEALCDFRFIPVEEWDATILGLFFNEIKEQFPNKEQEETFKFSFNPTSVGLEPKVDNLYTKMNFLNEKKNVIVQLLPDQLVVNHIKPYPGWEQFKEIILSNLEKFRKISSIKNLKRIGLRYINQINFNEPFEFEDYFKFYPQIPENLPQNYSAFKIKTDLGYPNNEFLRLDLFTKFEKDSKTIPIILDMDYYTTNPLQLDQVEEWIEAAHQRIEDAFENCLKDRMKEEFGEKLDADNNS